MIFLINKFFKKIGNKIYIGISLLIIAFTVLLSLISYNSFDRSFFYYDGRDAVITNILGRFGANLSATLFYLFGYGNFIFILFLFYVTAFFLFNLSFKNEWERLLAVLNIFFVADICCTIFLKNNNFFSSGGILGPYFLGKLESVINKPLIYLILFSSIFVSFLLIFRISFFYIFNLRNLRNLIIITEKAIYYSSLPFVYIAKWANSLLNGSALKELEEPHFKMEYNQIFEDNTLNTDPFWQEFFSPNNNIQENDIKTVSKESREGYIEPSSEYFLPDLNIFTAIKETQDDKKFKKDLEEQVIILEEKLRHFGVNGKVVSIEYGPIITLFEYQPNVDSKISRILALEDDLAMALQANSIRIIAPIPGKSVIGFEIANKNKKSVSFTAVVHSKEYQNFVGKLPLAIGEDTVGHKIVIDLASMPHLLVAGSTGSGKSVALNTMLISLLCKLSPDELRLILIDPKRLEFAAYSDIAHLLFPIVTIPKQAIDVLRWLVKEMETRYENMAKIGVKNILDYNLYCQKYNLNRLHYIVTVIDELADLMMTAGKDVETLIIRIAQMARASGIHLIVATQRPSVDVVTGLIKINFPSRMSFRVTSKVDSRTILDCVGAEKLLGKGDMLFLDPQSSLLRRIHGAFVSDLEISKIVNHIRFQAKVEYLSLDQTIISNKDNLDNQDDLLYQDVLLYLKDVKEVSISLLQRKFRIGFNRSARIIEALESQGYIIPTECGKTRKVVKN